MAAYPAALEQCPIMGWSEEPLQNVVEFQTEVGAQKRRRRTTNSGYLYTAQYKLTKSQLATFWAFYESIFDGVDRFTMTHPRTGATVTVQFDAIPSVQQITPKLFVASFTLRAWV